MNSLMKIETLPCNKLRNPIGENIPIYRMQVGFAFSKIKNTSTSGALYIQFNSGDKPFYLDTKISEFQTGATYYFDFLSYNVREIKDIQFLKIGTKGENSICFSKIELLINGIRKPVFSKIFGKQGHCLDFDPHFNPNELIINGTELRLSSNWKESINSNKIWLPIKSILKEMIVSLIESAVGNQLHYISGFSDGIDGAVDSLWSPNVEVKYVNSKSLHFELDLQQDNKTEVNVDVNFDLQFECKEGIIHTQLQNLNVNSQVSSDIKELIRNTIPALIEGLFGKMSSIEKNSGHYPNGLVSDWLAYSINISVDENDPPQSCKLIHVTNQCEIMVH